jgi:hypothetical protein
VEFVGAVYGAPTKRTRHEAEFVLRPTRQMRAGSAGDVDNARLAFQNALADEAAQKRPELWHYFQAFEVQHGSISDILQVEAQWQAALPQKGCIAGALAALDRLRRRFTHCHLWPCTAQQHGHLEMLQGLGQGPAATVECAPLYWCLMLLVRWCG